MTITPRMDRFVDCSESPNTRPTHCSRFQFKANDYLRGDVRKTGRFTHVSSILGHDVREKRFITHGRRNPRYKYLGRGIFQFADSVLSLPVK